MHKSLIYIIIAASIICMAAGPVIKTGWYDAESNLGRTIVTANSGYPSHDLSRHSVAYKSDGTMCAIWQADAGRGGSDTCYGCYSQTEHCMVGEKDHDDFDVVFNYGRSRPVGLLMLPGDVPAVFAVEAPLLQTNPPTPERLKGVRFNQITLEWEVWQNTSPDQFAEQTCSGTYGCGVLTADVVFNPANGWFGLAWIDGMNLWWTQYDGNAMMDSLALVGSNWVQPSAVIASDGTPHICLAGHGITGRGAGITYVTRGSNGFWTQDAELSINVFSGDIALSPSGEVVIAAGGVSYPDYSYLSLSRITGPGSWQNIPRPGTVLKPGGSNFAIAYDPSGGLNLVWYERDLKDLYRARLGTNGVWETTSRVTNDPQDNDHVALALNPLGQPAVLYRIGSSSYPDLGYTVWKGP
jgi:hypothetical protein